MQTPDESPELAKVRTVLGELRARIDAVLSWLGGAPADPNPLRRTGRLTRIEKDPELRAFIDARIGTLAQTDLVAECRHAFGPGRAPSQSGLNRYIHLAERRDKEQRK